jgi:nucleoside 2-deoxyribosyltransferase
MNILKRRIYLASSWRNPYQPAVLAALRDAGHEVYDFRNPSPGNTGFAWSAIDREWLDWTPDNIAELLASHPVAAAGFAHDKAALDWCDTCILALPCGRSAHLELGYAAGQGKDTYVLLHEDKFEPELMYLLNTGCSTSIEQIIGWMEKRQPGDVMRWHRENGGQFKRPASHALRLLCEVIELCITSGAEAGEIYGNIDAEIAKANARGDWGVNLQELPYEWADCQMLLDVFREHAGFDGKQAKREKLDILYDREWEADADGVLWRPGTKEVKEAA